MFMINDRTVEALSRFLDVDVARYKLVTANVANLDTPGYHTRDLDFGSELRRASVYAGAENSELAYASYSASIPAFHSAIVRSGGAPDPRPDGAPRRQQRDA